MAAEFGGEENFKLKDLFRLSCLALLVYCRGVEEAGVLVEVTSFPFKTEFLMSSVVMVNEVFLSE